MAITIQDHVKKALKAHHGAEWDKLNYSDQGFFECADNGVLIPHADTIVYRGKGVLLGGGSGSGKSSLANLLVRNSSNSHVVRNDSPTIYQHHDGKTYVVDSSDKELPFKCDFSGLFEEPPNLYELKAIVFLGYREDGNKLEEGNLRETCNWMFSFSDSNYEQRNQRYDEILGSLPICRAFRYDTIEDRSEAIKGFLDTLIR